MNAELENLIAEIAPHVTELRRDLHAHPEPAYQETYASELVRRELSAAGVEYVAPMAETGVVGWIHPTDPTAAAKKAVGLRADMDALPIAERTDLPHASQNPGCMHACGHDGHVAMLLGAAMVLAKCRDALPRPVKLLFQPAEEGGGGAKRLIEEGALTAAIGGCEIGAMFGLHGYSTVELGRLGLRAGPAKARIDSFALAVTGRGGHGGRPHETIDPVVAAAQIIVALQTVVSRNVPPIETAVLSVGRVRAGEAFNAIPESAALAGTIRSFRDEVAELVKTRLEEVATGVAEGFGCRVEVVFPESYPASVHDPAAVEFMRRAAAFLGPDGVFEIEPTTGAEDFAYYGQVVPSCQGSLGLRPPGAADAPNLHSATFDFNDDALPIGIRLFCELALGAGESDDDEQGGEEE